MADFKAAWLRKSAVVRKTLAARWAIYVTPK
jgi:hypothetical protein